jgi:hypothetical protein
VSQLSLFDSVESPADKPTQKIVEVTQLARRSLSRLEARQRIAQLDELFDRRCRVDGLRQCRGCGGFAKLTKHLCDECSEVRA